MTQEIKQDIFFSSLLGGVIWILIMIFTSQSEEDNRKLNHYFEEVALPSSTWDISELAHYLFNYARKYPLLYMLLWALIIKIILTVKKQRPEEKVMKTFYITTIIIFVIASFQYGMLLNSIKA